MEQGDFIKGALIGGCIGSVFAFFIAPKSGQKLREDILRGYHTIHDQTNEYIDEIKEQAQEAIDSFHGVEQGPNAFMIGSVSGAIIGAIAGLLLAPKAGQKLREQLGDDYDEICHKAQNAVKMVKEKGHDIEDKLEDWQDLFATIVDRLSPSSKTKKYADSKLEEIINWAKLGLRFFHQLQARR